ncbi:hypothetical protein COV14_04140 [Candidatus Woesearchaeota archaeon CG10_big_fil_rev_8_21_14_0_10_33_12]|nr:MAG: hypothetical protein COV14_04140 [Candidatus Woesearchaeota archaeon CG10_big_fil_rev_8_21_14_0_10_33_12]
MKEYTNKQCKLHINIGGKDLFFNAIITDVSDTHISFTDKYNDKFSFRIIDVVEIRLVNEEEKEKLKRIEREKVEK